MKKNQVDKLQKWITESIDLQYWKQYSDIHIDDIFRNPPESIWVEKTLCCLKTACKLLEKISNKYFVLAIIPLDNYTEDPIIFHLILNLEKLEKFFKYTPPSLYIFEHDDKPILQQIQESLSINIIIFDNLPVEVFLSRIVGDTTEFNLLLFPRPVGCPT